MTAAELAFLAALCGVSPQVPGENPLPVIQQFESGGQNKKNYLWGEPGRTATSEGQILFSTWNNEVVPRTGFPSVGPGTPYPNGVMDLDRFQRIVGIAVLYDTAEFQHWTCRDCNDDLRKFVKAQGPGAFKPPGSLTANPCALAQYINEKPQAPSKRNPERPTSKPEVMVTPYPFLSPGPTSGELVFTVKGDR